MCKPTAGNDGHKKDWYSWSTVYGLMGRKLNYLNITTYKNALEDIGLIFSRVFILLFS